MDLDLSLADSYPWLFYVLTAPIDSAGIYFFSHLGYCEEKPALLEASSGKTFVYSLLPEERLLNDLDTLHMGSIRAGAHLFDWSPDDYPEPSEPVAIYAVDIEDVGFARSEEAYAIHRIMSKFATRWSIVLFRHRHSLLLSFLKPTDTDRCAIYLSDWISYDTSDTGQLERIHVVCTSLNSPIDCFDGFMYEAIRPYYKEPLTHASAVYGILDSINVSTKIDLPLISREDLNEAADKAMSYYVDLYGDDYIEDKTLEIEADDDFNLEDVEWELENAALTDEDEQEERQPKPPLSFEDDNHDAASSCDTEDIPPEVMANPIALLDWLDNHPTKNTSGKASSHSGRLRVIPIGETPPQVGMHVRHISLGEGVITRSEPTRIEANFNGTRRILVFPAAFNNGTVELLGEA